jgi:putative membrane protein
MALAIASLLSTGVLANEKAALSASDQKIIKTLAADNRQEVQMGELATRKAQQADVKAFAEKMVTDHTRLNESLTALAKRWNIDTTKAEESKSASQFDNLDNQSGKNFDESYVKDMVKDHKKAVETYEADIKNAQNADLKSYLQDGLSTIKEHLQKAEHLESTK